MLEHVPGGLAPELVWGELGVTRILGSAFEFLKRTFIKIYDTRAILFVKLYAWIAYR